MPTYANKDPQFLRVVVHHQGWTADPVGSKGTAVPVD